MQLIFTPDDSGTTRARGYAIVPYSSNAEDETIVETTEVDLSTIFEDAKAGGGTLDGAKETIDAAIEEPLSFIDYLILNADGAIDFDDGHIRETSGGTTSA